MAAAKTDHTLRVFLRFFIPAAGLILAGLWLYGQAAIERELARLKSQEMLNVGLGAGTLSGHIEGISRDLAFLAAHTALRNVIHDPSQDNLTHLAEDFANFSRSKGIYDQLRWIDASGMEIVRVDAVDGQAVIVSANKLQNKGKRYFFTDSFKLNPGEIFISPLDLNIEQNQIEVPHKPMIRVATPVADAAGKKRGIIILNYYGRVMLDALAAATRGAGNRIMLLNSDGYWLKSPRPEDEWGFMFKRPELSLTTRAPAAWAKISTTDDGQAQLADGLWTWKTVYPLIAGQKSSTGAADAFEPSRGTVETHQYAWKTVAHLSTTALDEASRMVWGHLAGIGLLVLALVGFISRMLATAWGTQAAAEAEVRRVNAGLEATIAERTGLLNRKVTELGQANASLALAARVLETTSEGVMITDHQHRIIDLNRAFEKITGYARSEVWQQMPTMLLAGGPETAALGDKIVAELDAAGHWNGEVPLRHKDGKRLICWFNVSRVVGTHEEPHCFVTLFSDITLRKQAEDEIRDLAFFDPLTHLPNRRLMLDRLHQSLVSVERRERHGAVMLLDLDNFKNINDTLGHDAGDLLLRQAAERLQTCVRQGDTVARLGGDEFVVILEDLDSDGTAAMQAEVVAVKICFQLAQPYLLEIPESSGGKRQREFYSTSSIGIALFYGPDVDKEELIKRADTAMYEAKSAGRNTIRFYDQAMQSALTVRAEIEAELREAIVRKQFIIYCQPQFDGQGRMTGAETLVRWQHPERGMVSPAEFIPVAEESGLILPLGFWVLAEACRLLAAWSRVPQLAQLSLAVNISARQFSLPNLVEQVMSLVEAAGATPHKLKLELTESLLVHNTADVISKMNILRSYGVLFSLDDFGTGYSSLSYLKSLPLSQLKIDQSFVSDVLTDPNDAVIARTVIALGGALSLDVIAEGVETAEQRDFLAAAGCHNFQGYFFGRPMPVAAFEALATGHHQDASR